MDLHQISSVLQFGYNAYNIWFVPAFGTFIISNRNVVTNRIFSPLICAANSAAVILSILSKNVCINIIVAVFTDLLSIHAVLRQSDISLSFFSGNNSFVLAKQHGS